LAKKYYDFYVPEARIALIHKIFGALFGFVCRKLFSLSPRAEKIYQEAERASQIKWTGTVLNEVENFI
jgi:hypothetical protein